MKLYNSIPTDIKPPIGASKLHYADAFDSDFALLLREIKSATLPDMLKDDVEVEANLMASSKMKQKVEIDKKKVILLLPNLWVLSLTR